MPTDAGRHSMHVALCCDDQYAPMAGVTALSILLNRRSELDLCLHICHAGLSPAHFERFKTLERCFRCEVHFHAVSDTRVTGLREHLHISYAMYFRLLLPQMLQACERVIYLDCDLLVETDLEALWTMDLGGCAVAGWDEGEPQHLERLGLADDCYVNSGVLVMDLERWRDQAYGQACMDWIEANSQAAVLPDQDAMNVVLRGSKARLAEHWNLNPVWREESDLLTRYPERVIHFGGPVKPWDACYDFELAQRFKRYVDFSPWKAVFPFREPKNPTQLVILAHQLADAGEVEGSCRRYHAALMAMAEKRGALSPLVVHTINHAVRHYGLKRYAEAIEHFKDAVEFFGLPRHYSKNIYRLGGLLEGMF